MRNNYNIINVTALENKLSLKIDPRGSSRTRTFLEDNNTG